jgi:hypothetical protein
MGDEITGRTGYERYLVAVGENAKRRGSFGVCLLIFPHLPELNY